MKKTMIRIGKSVAIQIAAFSIICGMVAIAVSFPTATPAGQVSGGKFQQYFDSIFGAITFNSGKASTTTPTMSGHIATKGYVDNLPIDASRITGKIDKTKLESAPMPNSGDNSDKIATTSWVKANTASAATGGAGGSCYYAAGSPSCFKGYSKAPGRYLEVQSGVPSTICCPSVYDGVDFEYRSEKYQIQPSGCQNVNNEPKCAGDDYLTYTWQNAVNYCNNIVLNGKNDWYLPSKSEGREIYKNSNGGFASEHYWFDDEINSEFAYYGNMYNGSLYNNFYTNKSNTLYVRCIRKI